MTDYDRRVIVCALDQTVQDLIRIDACLRDAIIRVGQGGARDVPRSRLQQQQREIGRAIIAARKRGHAVIDSLEETD